MSVARVRQERIAAASGTRTENVREFLRGFEEVRALMKQMATMSLWQRLKMMAGLR